MKKKEQNGFTIKRQALTDDKVDDINFFTEDIVEMDNQLNESKKLYNEIHDLFAQTTGGEYVPTRSLRDIAEITKSLISARTLCADIVNKRTAIKKIVADNLSKKKGNTTENDIVNETARKIVESVNAQTISKAVSNMKVLPTGEVISKPSVDQTKSSTSKEEALLERSINDALNSGKIVMTKNDKLISVSGHVETQYDDINKKFIAVDSRTGDIIPDFPEERLPNSKVAFIENGKAKLTSGETVKVFGEESDDYDPTTVEMED